MSENPQARYGIYIYMFQNTMETTFPNKTNYIINRVQSNTNTVQTGQL